MGVIVYKGANQHAYMLVAFCKLIILQNGLGVVLIAYVRALATKQQSTVKENYCETRQSSTVTHLYLQLASGAKCEKYIHVRACVRTRCCLRALTCRMSA